MHTKPLFSKPTMYIPLHLFSHIKEIISQTLLKRGTQILGVINDHRLHLLTAVILDWTSRSKHCIPWTDEPAFR